MKTETVHYYSKTEVRTSKFHNLNGFSVTGNGFYRSWNSQKLSFIEILVEVFGVCLDGLKVETFFRLLLQK